jgi:hypothetical protein
LYYAWRAQLGGMTCPEAKRLRELEVENALRKKLRASIGDGRIDANRKKLNLRNPVQEATEAAVAALDLEQPGCRPVRVAYQLCSMINHDIEQLNWP